MKSMKKLSLFALLAAMMVVMAACGGGASTDKSKDSSKGADTSKPAQKELSGSLVISGSTAMQPLVAAAAEEFMGKNPKVDIQVNAGGSGTGLSQVAQGAVQIGNSDVFAEEKQGIPADQLVDHKVAVVGMTAAVNPKVGIKDIKKADLIKVFTGQITNWKDLGGPDQKIVLVNRPDSSGTRAVFNKFALDGAKPAEGVTEDASNTVKKIINETPGAIGYLAFSYLNDNTVTPLAIDGVAPTAENVQTGKFPVWAYEHSYTKGQPTDLEKAFLDFLMSSDVQNNIVKKQGYLPVTDMKVERDPQGNVKKK
ncbi:phosphate ABC transporter substrate-binding protein [Neobacillus massiliamazoniensis]|uniref:Phosphate-binding protein n=1 Tax=Neobacillus massiliamazoniensis TaxID=1499688 RepID=A0A0U1P1P0_9BACI|nr:phosphate ABC transporter substrate-binding protein [Neobacillus massiliamazoniensis]CRK84147.1 phosphate ABC transporter binding protein [Neobacillus massiliamazoniensis]